MTPGHPIQFTELGQFKLSEEVARLLPLDFCLENRVLVLGDDQAAPASGRPVGMVTPRDEKLVREIQQRLGTNVAPVQLNDWEIRYGLARLFDIEEKPASVHPMLDLRQDCEIHFGTSRPVNTILREILSVAVRRRATDVHIECYRNDVDIRFRIDGVLHQVTSPLSVENARKVISAIKVMAEMDVFEKRRPQDGSFRVTYETTEGLVRDLDLRVAVMPGPYGEDTVIRVLDKVCADLPLEDLGLSARCEKLLRKAAGHPYGLMVIAGPTGAGKTTTFYAIINKLKSHQNKILSIEDPIEFHLPKVNQKQVSSRLGFAEYVRAFMRQDPDIMLVGEIRDEQTAQVCMRAAQMGHLILTTLHANDAVGIILRLQLLGIQPEIVAENLVACVSQRLVRRLCPHCRKRASLSADNREHFAGFDLEPDQWVSGGCAQCDGFGYRGRIGVFEVLVPSPKIQSMIARHTTMSELRTANSHEDFQPMIQDAVQKARDGLTSLDEIRRLIPIPQAD